MAECARCNSTEGTEKWVGDSVGLAFAHGAYEFWCKRCVVMAQLEHANQSVQRIPELEAELARLEEKKDATKNTNRCRNGAPNSTQEK